jgi:uncharacterized protein Yka (UPF0111/DUF47 family)
MRHRWFLPVSPDVLGMLRAQMVVTGEGMSALVAWARGSAGDEAVLRDSEHRADEHKRALRRALRTAFTTPLAPEDLYALSQGLDGILNGAKNLVRESEVMAMPPDEPVAEMAGLLAEGVAHVAEAFAHLGDHGEEATAAADRAIRCQRRMERVYRRSMSALLAVDDLPTVMGRRELYRRLARLGDALVDVAERVWYTVVKEA